MTGLTKFFGPRLLLSFLSGELVEQRLDLLHLVVESFVQVCWILLVWPSSCCPKCSTCLPRAPCWFTMTFCSCCICSICPSNAWILGSTSDDISASLLSGRHSLFNGSLHSSDLCFGCWNAWIVGFWQFGCSFSPRISDQGSIGNCLACVWGFFYMCLHAPWAHWVQPWRSGHLHAPTYRQNWEVACWTPPATSIQTCLPTPIPE